MHRTLWICTEFVFHCSVQRNIVTFISTFFYVVCVSSCPFGMKRCTSAHLGCTSCCCIVLGGIIAGSEFVLLFVVLLRYYYYSSQNPVPGARFENHNFRTGYNYVFNTIHTMQRGRVGLAKA